MAEQNPLSRRSLLLQGGAAGAALGAMALPASATTTTMRKASRTCVLDGLQPAALTISGPGVQANRGKPQAVADRMLIIHGYQFDAAWSCGMDALNSLEQQTLRTTLEYDEAEHSLQGPLLEQVLQAAGVDVGQAMARGLQLTLQGIDGYRSQMPLAQAVRWRMVIATQLDGVPLAMGGVGPLWAIFAAHEIPELGQLPVKQRFAAAVWGLYHLQLGSATA
ncbi:Twin-arginine translocation pathway signal [Comamonas testosteroni]|uniref:Twin-arginine translocation pathway signal n=1 Tax=Comamonas testosteroni TaxID=285 RepID=UPI00265F7A16|nr:Twin-arginine translocation pathway signal [Comamonas testosteroni]WKL17111.1 Twin-arginine translocation pathway signal [Comamonas testosteroni]